MPDRPAELPAPRSPGDPDAARAHLDAVFSAAYEELRRLAATIRRHERAQTLTPTALVNEAWIKLSRTPAVADTPPLHFRRIAARAMRQVLVEAARHRTARKRGGPEAVAVTFDEAVAGGARPLEDVLDLDEALQRLAGLDERQAQLVEWRFFGGLENAEIAALLGVSESTVQRDWRAAQAWLARELRAEP